ncbi:MAG TPA: PH domain-containing protein [Terrimesophilobacter sp.]|nr:PH domain-containing protein [Terrimesophilobacter sp.]HRP99444.1 PH domain-containing protein [Terrimesophilobacter sp.]
MRVGASESFHSRFNRFLAISVWALCAAAIAAVIAAGEARFFSMVPFAAAVGLLAWAGLWRVAIVIDDQLIELRNAFSTVLVPWAALVQVDTRFALTLITPSGSFTSTAAPAPSRLTTMLSKRDIESVPRDVPVDGAVRPGDIPSTDSGAAAILIRRRWRELLDAGRVELGVADRTPVLRHVHWTTIVVSGGLLVAAIAVLAAT